MSNRTRLTPEQRRLQILNAAVDVALEKGLYNFSVINVARSLPACSKQTVKHYFKNVALLRTAVITEAIKRNHDTIVAQAITMNHEAVANLTTGDRRKYLDNV